MVGPAVTVGLSRDTSHDETKFKKIKFIQHGGRKGVVTRGNVQFMSLEITEPELDPKANAEKEEYMASVFATFQESLEKTKLNLGYAMSLDFDYSALGKLPHFLINNFGDPFIQSNFNGQSRQFEMGVLDWFARLLEMEKDEYWGYVTNGGSEGNLHGILLGREIFPDGIFYTSKDSHFSIFKAARMYRMECVTIDTLISGEIDCADFKTKLLQNKDKPAVINLSLGTTMKGAIDDIDLVIETLNECGFNEDRFYIHCDGAMYGFMLPLLNHGMAPKITFKKPIGSISVSGHKFIGCPMPCGIQMTRIKHIKMVSREVEYIATRDATISCSRNGHAPIFLWYALNKKGYRGFKQDFEKCLSNARYLKDLIKEAGMSVMLNNVSSTVVFERPHDQDLIQRWQLSCEGDMTHAIVMPSDNKEKLDTFYKELVASRSSWLREGYQPVCVAHHIGVDNCVCAMHNQH